MSLIVTLPSEKTLNVKGKTLTASQLEVLKVVDLPNKKAVIVLIKGLGKVKVTGLSKDGYDNPQWTNESLAAALVTQFTT